MDMIERVARALWDAQSTKLCTWDALPPSRQEGMRDRARAAISAMRDPTVEMGHAGALEEDGSVAVYRAMIETALWEGIAPGGPDVE